MFSKEEEKIIQHRIDTMRPIKIATTDELVAELCKREGVDEYLHGENSHFDILKMNNGVGGKMGDNQYMIGYKTIPATSRILVVNRNENRCANNNQSDV